MCSSLLRPRTRKTGASRGPRSQKRKRVAASRQKLPGSLLDIDFSQPVYVLIDRIVVGPDQRTRIVDALETGYREAGETVFELAPPPQPEIDAASDADFDDLAMNVTLMQWRFSHRFECKNCHI